LPGRRNLPSAQGRHQLSRAFRYSSALGGKAYAASGQLLGIGK
jgi:hypothetical protein